MLQRYERVENVAKTCALSCYGKTQHIQSHLRQVPRSKSLDKLYPGDLIRTWAKLLASDALVNAGEHFLVQVTVVVDAAQVPDEVLQFHALQSQRRKEVSKSRGLGDGGRVSRCNQPRRA